MHQKRTILRVCEQCGTSFLTRLRRQRFCSRSCGTTKPLAMRFWRKVDRGSSDGCWLWIGARRGSYGMFRPTADTQISSHRMAYELANGPIPDGLCVCHRCDNPLCVRPDHLWLGTIGENNADRVAKGRSATGDRSGPRLHPERLRRGPGSYPNRRPEMYQGTNNKRARLTNEIVTAIRAEYATGTTTQEAIGRKYGISQPHVQQIVSRRIWTHIE
jgi:hypothetical protein